MEEGDIEKKIQGMGRSGKRRKKLLDYFKETKDNRRWKRKQ